MNDPVLVFDDIFTRVRKLALELMGFHGLTDWTFGFNRRKRSMGLCLYKLRAIELSVYFVRRNNHEEIRDTILHEIAHALVGPEHGHNSVWKQKCVEIGAKPNRCANADMPEGRWQSHCCGCDSRHYRHRKPKRATGWYCRKCGPELGKLVWKDRLDDRSASC